MANQPIGINFIPSADNAAQGPQRASLEGGNSDLAQAWKVLSLNLPRVLGARSLAPKRLLQGGGSAAVQSNADPHAAAFQALIQAMLSGGMGGGTPDQRSPNVYGDPSPTGYGDFMRNEPRAPFAIPSDPGPAMGGGGVPAPNLTFGDNNSPNLFNGGGGSSAGSVLPDPWANYRQDAGPYGTEG